VRVRDGQTAERLRCAWASYNGVYEAWSGMLWALHFQLI
jgi:hypothetical protein